MKLRPNITSLAVALVGVGILVIACSDLAVSDKTAPLVEHRMSAAQLHAANKFDWVGKVHHIGVRAIVSEWKKHKGNMKAACRAAETWVDTSSELASLLPAAYASQKHSLKAAVRRAPDC